LSSRLDGVGFAGKTGSLDMVAALSGYLRTDNGNEVIVSVIANHYLCPNVEARTVLDDFVRASQKLRP
jgi:D-alanyl-D-alanine carboxypeptidase